MSMFSNKYISRWSVIVNSFNPLSINPIKWLKTLKQFINHFLGVLDHFVGLALKRLKGLLKAAVAKAIKVVFLAVYQNWLFLVLKGDWG